MNPTISINSLNIFAYHSYFNIRFDELKNIGNTVIEYNKFK